MTDDSWMDISEGPSTDEMPGIPLGAQAIALATDAIEKKKQFVEAWESLSIKQRIFLNTWRDSRFNANRAIRALAGTPHALNKSTITNWGSNEKFTHVRELLREASVTEILSKANLVARQDDIVETLLTPKPILFQGHHTGYEEIDGSAAARANETLLKVGGHLKEKDIDLNVGIIGPQFTIQVVQRDGSVIDAVPRGVPIELPEPEVVDAEWIES